VIPFIKAHACGNDFLIVEDIHARRDHAGLTRRLCARNTGIGADGVEFVAAESGGAIPIRLINADGSEAEISGNGTRCVAAWLAHSVGKKDVVLVTKAGPRRCRVLGQQGSIFQVETEMGVPAVQPRTLRLPGGLELQGAEVSVGNPHFVVFVETEDFSIAGQSWQAIGERIALHAEFPNGSNAEFVRIRDAHTIEFRIYERGVGPTLSSGTGTCASASASIALRGVDRKLSVIAEGGPQTIHWPSAQQPILLTGPAEIIATGEAF
jgi:diaminopimelate epimerase